MVIYGIPRTGNYRESLSHQRAKVRIAKIVDQYLEENNPGNWEVNTYYEYEIPNVKTPKGRRNYYADVLSEIVDGMGGKHQMIIELDGKVGHSSSRNRKKDAMRNEALENIGIPTVRFDTRQISGYKPRTYYRKPISAISDSEILRDLDLSRNLKLSVFSIDMPFVWEIFKSFSFP